MASISKQANGRRTIQFTADTGKRHSIRLGKISQRNAEAIKTRVERILESQLARQPLDADTALWLGEIDDSLHSKLARAGLVESREKKAVKTLGVFLADYVTSRIDVKPATQEVWRQVILNLNNHFGADCDLTSINEGHADDFKMFLISERLAPTTIHKRLQFVRMFFQSAKKKKLILENPFAETSAPAGSPKDRQRFITVEDTEKLLAVANPTWRTIIALARFGGLRCPSEVLSLRWEDVLWDSEKIVVTSPKTEHHAGKENRVMPLFPELLPILLEAAELAEEGAEYVVGGNYRQASQGPSGWRNSNLRTQFGRIIKRAGLQPWPRLFQNLRASRETELVREHPIHVVTSWLGNTPTIAVKHYLQVTDADFERASKSAAKSGAMDAETASKALQNPVQTVYATARQDSTEPPQPKIESPVMATTGDFCCSLSEQMNGGGGIRTPGTLRHAGFQDRCNFVLTVTSSTCYGT